MSAPAVEESKTEQIKMSLKNLASAVVQQASDMMSAVAPQAGPVTTQAPTEIPYVEPVSIALANETAAVTK